MLPAPGMTRGPFPGRPPSKDPIHFRDKAQKAYRVFRRLALARFDLLVSSTEKYEAKSEIYKALGVLSKLDYDREVKLFRTALEKSCDLACDEQIISKSDNPLFFSLREAFVQGDLHGLATKLIYSFQDFLMRTRFSSNISATHKKIADCRNPHEWFPATRAMQRTIHLHVGPTNSGKTYNALKALEEAKSGIYAGPLRLLAHEVYSRFIAKGKKCALITGEEQRIPEGEDNYFRSCTVEMTSLNHSVDVAVIDEIQMIGDSERGWAWTQAFLGVQAKEVHLCGEERAVELIQSLCTSIGDKLVIHRYKRLSPLETMSKSLQNDFRKLEKGDAVIAFSRVDIHSLKNTIEEKTGRRVAIVYGSLPPETRAQQAALFNNPNNDYDFLVASDAIGMGLNLEIKRIIFIQTHKRDSTSYRQISTSEIKQIGGRAGRFRTANQAIQSGSGEPAHREQEHPPKRQGQLGLVTTYDQEDLPVIQEAFQRDPEPLKTAGIQPPPAVIERFSSYFPPNTPFSYIISRLRDIARVGPQYHLCHLKEMLQIADLIQPYPMSVYDRCVFLNAPVFLREPSGIEVLQSLAKCVSNMEGGNILDIHQINLELLDVKEDSHPRGKADYLRQIETLHKAITLYLWLSYRYSGVFVSQNVAFRAKELVEEKINYYLSEISMSDKARKTRLDNIRKAAKAAERKKILLDAAGSAEKKPPHEGPGEWKEEGHEEPLYEDTKELQQMTIVEPHHHQNQEGHHKHDSSTNV